MFNLLISACNYYCNLLYIQVMITSFLNINQYHNNTLIILREFTLHWLLIFQGIIPLFYGVDFSPILAILTLKSFIKFLERLKKVLC